MGATFHSSYTRRLRSGGSPQQKKPPQSYLLRILLVTAALALAIGLAVFFVPLSPAVLTTLAAYIKSGQPQSGASNGKWSSLPVPKAYVEPNEEEIARLQRAAKVLDPEVMKHVPPEFNSSFKNPCWTAVNGEFRCLPYFYITGMFHAGALSLQDKLARHPDVLVDVCTGCQFWGEEGKTMELYLDNMRNAARAIQGGLTNKVLMDSSPSTFAFYWAGGGKTHRGFQTSVRKCHGACVDQHHRNSTPIDQCMAHNCYNQSMQADMARAAAAGIDYEREAHNPLLVRAVYGLRPPRMILVARNPVDRLYSAFHGYVHYHGKYGKSSAGFTAYVKEQVGALKACAADHGEARCALLFEALGAREEKVYFHADQLMRGMYGLFLEIWYRFIPPPNWLVIHSDDLFTNPKATVARAVEFLGLSSVNDTQLTAMAAEGRAKSYTTGQQPMEPEARRLLADLYRPYNTLLASLTGDARFEAWNKDATP